MRQRLFARVLATNGVPDRELDADIWWALDRARAMRAYNAVKLGLPTPLEQLPDVLPRGLGRVGVMADAPRFTESVEAAIRLRDAVLPGKSVSVWDAYGCWWARVGDNDSTDAPTAAIALLLALLLAMGEHP